jgi:hypothetical protein
VEFVEAVVGLGHALVGRDHQRGAVVVVGLADTFQDRVSLVAQRKWEGLEAVRERVTQPVLQRRREEPGPDLVDAGLENGERGKVWISQKNNGLRKD